MTPGIHNGLFSVITETTSDYREDIRLGFYVEDASDSEDDFDALFKTDATDLSYDEKVKRLKGIKQEMTDMGYTTGPLESKTHREWCAEVFDVTDLQEAFNEDKCAWDEEE
jgi:hypothetical protein